MAIKSYLQIFSTTLLLALTSTLLAQDHGFDFAGSTVKELVKNNQTKSEQSVVPFAVVTIYQDSLKLKELKTDKKNGGFMTKLPYGHVYKIFFSHPTCIPMFLIIDARIPKEKYKSQMRVEVIGIPFVDKKSVYADTAKYRFACDKFIYDAKKKGIVRDEQYFNDFIRGKNRDYLDYMAVLLKNKNTVITNTVKPNTEKTDDFLGKLISGNLLALINNIAQPIANTRVKLTNEKGVMIETVLTNDFGTFVFTKLPASQNFLIELAENDPKLANVKVIITDKNGKEITSSVCNSTGQFQFEFLKQDELKLQMMEVEESVLRMDMKGKLFKNTSSQTLANTKLELLNEKEQIVQTTSSDNAGNFKFTKVPFEKNYSINMPFQAVNKLILADANGVVIKEYTVEGIVNTIKMPLLPADQQRITSVSLDDPWLKVTSSENINGAKDGATVIPEKVYFEVNDFKITKEAQFILDKVVQVMKVNSKVKIEVSSHTDSQGSDEYNLELSKKRAKSAVDYMIAHGISKERASGVGYGETKLINKCSNGVVCNEDQHAQNRRLEFKVMYIN